MLPEEFHEFVAGTLRPLGVRVLDHRGEELADGEGLRDRVGLFYLAPEGAARRVDGRVQPGREGWLALMLPAPSSDTVFKAQLGAKSEWRDPATGEARDSPEVLEFFAKVAASLRLLLTFGVIAKGRGTSRFVKNVGLTDGARRWAEAGGRLRQAGVAHGEFLPPE